MDSQPNTSATVTPPVSQAPVTPTASSATKDKAQNKNFPIKLIIGLAIGAIIFIGGSALFMQVYPQIMSQKNNENTAQNLQFTPTPTPEDEIAKPTENTLFYIGKDRYDIYSVNIDTLQEDKLTVFPDKDSVVAQVITGDKIGYSRCFAVSKNYGCEVHTVSLPDKTDSKLHTMDADKSLSTVGWYLPNVFAYISRYSKSEKDARQNLLLINNGTKQLEELISTVGAQGRGGFEGDSRKISFSADGKYLFRMDTASITTIMDMNIYIFGVDTEFKKVIPKATHPVWMNTTTVAYSSVDEGRKAKIFTYDVTTSEEVPHETGKDILGAFSLLNDQVLYKSTDKAIYLYDLTTKENKKILDNAMTPAWVNKDVFAYTETATCNGDNCGMLDYNVKGVKLYNLTDGSKKTVLAEGVEFLNYFTSHTK